jgi:hypothetical protein
MTTLTDVESMVGDSQRRACRQPAIRARRTSHRDRAPNRAGREGWELVSAAEDVNNVHGSTEVHRYHLKRLLA